MGEIGYNNQIPENISKINPSICIIKVSHRCFIGFLIKIMIKEFDFFCLMTSGKYITKEMVNTNQQIIFNYDAEQKNKNINLNISQRYIEFFEGSDTLLVQIIDEDEIKPKYFLSVDMNCNSFNRAFLRNQEITVLGLMDNTSLYFTNGKILEMINNEIIYKINDEKINKVIIGSPVFFKNKTEVIGITKGNNDNIEEKTADLIGPIYKYFKEMIEIISIEGGLKYIGPLENDMPNGHGKYYFRNNNEIYDGDIINDQFEGKGKYVYSNGEYYVGQFKNNLRHGKGVLYYNDNKIKYEGDFKEDKYEGNGKYYYENGEYYIGPFKNNFNNGKGKLYYSNGNLKYEGDFVNDKFEGNGKYVYEDDVYYIGRFKSGLKHGKGKLYTKDGKIIYDGTFNNGNYDGYGRYYFENRDYYEGQFQNGLWNGKGKECHYNGQIIKEGIWVNDVFKKSY